MGDFRMPSLGADMDEGTLLEWLVKPGDTVHRGDIVAVVDTAKSAVEVECFADGVVEALVVDPGQVVPVGGVLARLGESVPSNGQPGAATAKGTPPPEQPPATEPSEPGLSERAGRQPVLPQTTPAAPSPLVRRRAHELGIDLTTVHGSGECGAVVRQDLEALAQRAVSRPRVSPLARRLAKTAGVDLSAVSGTGAGGAIRADDIRKVTTVGTPKSEAVDSKEIDGQNRDARPISGHGPERVADQRAIDMRNSIAALMSRSKREIPHYYLSTTVDLQRTSEWMKERNRELPVGARLVPSAALLSAAARAAREVPQLNGHWVDGGFRPAQDVDLGLILSLRSGGLLVPVLKAADTLDISQVMALMRELTRRARAGRLRGSELSQPSISVSNLGDQGVESVLGVIYPPQVALVGFGAVTPRPWAVDGLLGIRPLVTVTLAADHRATDAATGARLLKAIDRILQTPEEP
jgi:pyruvate dehydrogenase E2 component (dihydrolipoamide acetyltransferase)